MTNEPLAAVKSEGKWGYIDKSGKFVTIPAQFEKLGQFAYLTFLFFATLMYTILL